jgi:TPR repeat protein
MSRLESRVTGFFNLPHKQDVANPERAAIGDSQEALEASPAAPDITGTAAPVAPTTEQTAAPENQKFQEPTSKTQDASAQAAGYGDKADADKAGDTQPRGASPSSSSQVDLALAQKYLGDASGPDENAKGVELLWLATEKGSVDAELQLADLYTRGVAVPKSCVQARILLKAAYNANPAAAQQRLDEMDKAGCS